ncbi:MAG: hypothetical protein U1F33_12210 [Alphaproteobacteria bacterium]
MFERKSRAMIELAQLQDLLVDRLMPETAPDTPSGHPVVFSCEEGFGFGYLTGQHKLADDGTVLLEIRLNGGCKFVCESHLTMVQNAASVVRAIGQC